MADIKSHSGKKDERQEPSKLSNFPHFVIPALVLDGFNNSQNFVPSSDNSVFVPEVVTIAFSNFKLLARVLVVAVAVKVVGVA